MIYNAGDNVIAPYAFAGNSKAFDKFRLLEAFEAKAAGRLIKYLNISFLDCFSHLDQLLLEILHPELHANDVALAMHANAVATALLAEPPTPAPVPPVLSALRPRQPVPQTPPPLPPNATAAKVREHERAIESAADFLVAYEQMKAFLLVCLDQGDTETVRATFAGGLAMVTIKQVISYVWETYPRPSPAQISTRQSCITAKFDRSMSLLLNFRLRLMHNQDLLRACPAQAYTSSALFIIFYGLCMEPSNRLRPVVYRYTLQPSYDYSTAQAEDFVKFMVSTNLVHIHDEGTGHLAFQGEDDYVAQRLHPLALATPAVPTAAPPPLALAAPAPPAGTPSRGPRIRPFGLPSRLPGGAAPAGLPLGKICFVHGFQRDHNSRSCPTMEADPGNYTFAQRSLVRFPAGSNPMIDGKKCNLTCAPGVGPHP